MSLRVIATENESIGLKGVKHTVQRDPYGVSFYISDMPYGFTGKYKYVYGEVGDVDLYVEMWWLKERRKTQVHIEDREYRYFFGLLKGTRKVKRDEKLRWMEIKTAWVHEYDFVFEHKPREIIYNCEGVTDE